MTEPVETRRLAETVAKRLKSGGGSFVEIARDVIRKAEVPKAERQEMLSAIGAELSARKHIGEARQLPDALPKELPKPREEQIGFGWGERREGEKKIRPPTRRHL